MQGSYHYSMTRGAGGILGGWLGWVVQDPAGQAWARARLLDTVVVLVLVIATTAPVALMTKLGQAGFVQYSGYVWLIAALAGFGLGILAPVRTFLAGLRVWPFVLITGWAAATFAWTMNDYETLRAVIYLAATHVTAVAIAAQFTWRRILVVVTWSLALTVLPSVFLAIAAPGLGRMQEIHAGAWSGLWMEKQLMGFYCCQLILAVGALVTLDRRLWPTALMIPVALLGIFGATGRTAMVMVGLAIIAMPVVGFYQGGRKRIVVLPWLAVLGACVLGFAVLSGLDVALQALGRGADLTGRVEIWREVQALIEERPIKGYGYQAIFSTSADMTSPYQWIADNSGFTPYNAHSSWLEAQLGLGTPGLVLLIACMVFAWLVVLLRVRRDGAGSMFSVATLLTATVVSFTESTLLNQMDLQWLLVVLVVTKAVCPDPQPRVDAPAREGDPVRFAHTPDTMGQDRDGGYEYNPGL
jgi:exopolysaccharide production protein ExoQ